MALTQNTSSRQSAYFQTNQIKIHIIKRNNTHNKSDNSNENKIIFLCTKWKERDAIKINVSFPFSLKSYLHVCYSNCCWNEQNCSRTFRDVLSVERNSVCLSDVFYWHSFGINLNRLFSSCFFMHIFLVGFWFLFHCISNSLWYRTVTKLSKKKMMIKRKTWKCWREWIKKKVHRIIKMHTMWCACVRIRCDLCVRHDPKYIYRWIISTPQQNHRKINFGLETKIVLRYNQQRKMLFKDNNVNLGSVRMSYFLSKRGESRTHLIWK